MNNKIIICFTILFLLISSFCYAQQEDISNTVQINNYLKPGDSGQIIVNIKNSENPIFEFYKETNKPTNLYFVFNNKKYMSLLDINDDLKSIKKEFLYIDYYWNYETGDTLKEINNNDLIDTFDSKNNYSFSARLIANKSADNETTLSINVMPRTGFASNSVKSDKINNKADLKYLHIIGRCLIGILLFVIYKIAKKWRCLTLKNY